jgi:hypothetical protein
MEIWKHAKFRRNLFSITCNIMVAFEDDAVLLSCDSEAVEVETVYISETYGRPTCKSTRHISLEHRHPTAVRTSNLTLFLKFVPGVLRFYLYCNRLMLIVLILFTVKITQNI